MGTWLLRLGREGKLYGKQQSVVCFSVSAMLVLRIRELPRLEKVVG